MNTATISHSNSLQSTRTLWGAVLAHTAGDVLVMLGYFWSLL